MTVEEYKALPKWKGKIFMKDEETCYKDGYLAGLQEKDKQIEELKKENVELKE